MNCFPAGPGTWLIDLDPDVEPVPIIGWAVSGPVAMPILPVANDPVSGQAYRLPGTGAVVDPAWSRTFESDDAWRAAAGRSAPYEMGVSLLFGTEEKKQKAERPKVTQTVETVPQVSEEVSAQLTFGKKVLKNKSFFHFTGSPEGVFVIEGGNALPADGGNAKRITRDEFFALRKTVPEITVALAEDDDSEDLV